MICRRTNEILVLPLELSEIVELKSTADENADFGKKLDEIIIPS